MEQTAVDWLIEQLKEYDFADIKDSENYIIKIPVWVLDEKYRKSKAQEKEQIINAHLTGLIYSLEMDATKQAEQYYIENYESK
jgi:hypothetical protein